MKCPMTKKEPILEGTPVKIVITYDGLGQIYSCSQCGFRPYRLINKKGWGKAQYLRGQVRKHIKECHQ